MKEKTTKGTCKIAGDKTVFSVVKKSGESQGAESERIIEQNLCRMNNVRSGNKLQDPISKSGNEAGNRTVPVADKTHYEHAEQCRRTAVWQTWKLDNGGNDSCECDGSCGKDELLCFDF